MGTFDAAELEQLAAETERDTYEHFRANDNYAHARLIKQYCGLPHEYPLPGIYPHGYYLAGRVYPKEAEHPLPNLFLYSKRHQATYARSCAKRSFPIGAPILFARALIADEIARLRAQARGSIVFPIHSTPHLKLHQDRDELVRRLRELPEQFHPVSVCLYYVDIQRGFHKVYLDAGFPVYTAGHKYRPDFMLRVTRALATHRYVIVNEVSTAFLNGAVLGLTSAVVRQDLSYEGRNKHLTDLQAPESPEGRALEATTQLPLDEAGPQQLALANDIFGVADFPRPETLKELLLSLSPEADRIMRRWNRPWNRGLREITRWFKPRDKTPVQKVKH